MVSDNLCKIHEKLNRIKMSLIDEEENEYENFYNRINFYFSNIVTELKLSFVEQIKIYKNKENDLKIKIKNLESENERIHFNFFKLEEDFKKSKNYNSNLNEKINKMEEGMKIKNLELDRSQKMIKIINKKVESSEKDIVSLIMDKMILQIELENSYNNEESNLNDITQYIEYPVLTEVQEISNQKEIKNNFKDYKEREIAASQYNLINHKIPFKTQSNVLLTKNNLTNSLSKSRNRYNKEVGNINFKTECQEGKLNLMESYQKSKSKEHYTNENKSNNKSNLNLQNLEVRNSNYNIFKTYSTYNNVITQGQSPHKRYENEVFATQGNEERNNNSINNLNDKNQSHIKSNSMIMNYRKNAHSIKDLKINISTEQNYSRQINTVKNNHSVGHKTTIKTNNSSQNLNKNGKSNINIVQNFCNEKEVKDNFSQNTIMSSNLSKMGSLNSGVITSISMNKIKSKIDKNLINSSVEFEKYKSTLLDKLNNKKIKEKSISNNFAIQSGITGFKSNINFKNK